MKGEQKAFGTAEVVANLVDGYGIDPSDCTLETVYVEIPLPFWKRCWNLIRGRGWRQYSETQFRAKATYHGDSGFTLL